MTPGDPYLSLAQFVGPSTYSADLVLTSLNAVAEAHSESSAREACQALLSAIGNNHAGTMYPAAIEAARRLRQIDEDEPSEWTAWAIDEIFLDLATFTAAPGFRWVQLPSGQLCDLEQTVKALLDCEIDVANSLLEFAGWPVDSLDASGLAPIHQSARTTDHNKDLAQLLELGAELDLADSDGWTALHHAAACGYDHNVRLLVEHQANTAATTDTGLTAHQLAAKNGHVLLAQSLQASEQ